MPLGSFPINSFPLGGGFPVYKVFSWTPSDQTDTVTPDANNAPVTVGIYIATVGAENYSAMVSAENYSGSS